MAGSRFYKNPGWWKRPVTGIVIGGVLGWMYYYFVGCRTGTCAITGNPVNSTLYGAMMGLIWVFPTGKKMGNPIKESEKEEYKS